MAVGPEFFYCGGDEGTLSLWRLADFKNIKNLEVRRCVHANRLSFHGCGCCFRRRTIMPF